ncbi:MAG TPA: ABC transporter permease [Phycisphaerae bacterium]|nr:ABC transporter permease [Phycisphaerae bacterium]
MSIADQSTVTFLAGQTVSSATPLILAGIGELIGELSGVINIGIEGLMLSGCITAYTVADVTGNGWIGLGAAILAGMFVAALFALVTIWAKADQIVTGTALNLLAAGSSATIWAIFENWRENSNLPIALPDHAGFSRLNIPYLSQIPFIGPAILNQYGIFYFTVLLAIVMWWILHHTRLGLIIRALGDSPETCAAAGVKVRLYRTLCVLFAGGCAGAAGAYLSIMRTESFVVNMTGGAGFVVLVLVIFGRWSFIGLTLGCLLFGFLNSFQQTLQTARYTSASAWLQMLQHIPFEYFQMLPYLAAIFVLAILSHRESGPRALGRPWPE